ncbi:MAG: DUF3987 domain-containing protein [Uliginosibacterium sp.]|nr:DUF3987 domain-containing protein [Uliginosibacterium sp.]
MADRKVRKETLYYDLANELGISPSELARRINDEADAELGIPSRAEEIRSENHAASLVEGVAFESDDPPAAPVVSTPAPVEVHEIGFPPGVAGMAARWLEPGNLAPNPLASIVSVLSAPAAICGRAWTNDQPQRADGLSLYMCLLAPSGAGKEWMVGGVRRLIRASGAPSDCLGARPASGAGLEESVADNPCQSIPLGEIGKWLQQVASGKAAPYEVAIQRAILALYNETDEYAVHVGTAKAGKAGTKSVESPCLSIMGESTHDSFYQALSDDARKNGLLSRFVVFDAGRERPRQRRTANMGPIPPEVERTLQAMAGTRARGMSPSVYGRNRIRWSPEAIRLDEELFDRWNDVMTASPDMISELISRTRQSSPRIAGILALWDDPDDPEVMPVHVQWAWDVCNAGGRSMARAFQTGEIVGESVDFEEMVYQYMAQHAKESNGWTVPRNSVRAWMAKSPAFRGRQSDALSDLLNKIIKQLCDGQQIAPVGEEDRRRLKIRGQAYVVQK